MNLGFVCDFIYPILVTAADLTEIFLVESYTKERVHI
jgi:hypothetical protein